MNFRSKIIKLVRVCLVSAAICGGIVLSGCGDESKSPVEPPEVPFRRYVENASLQSGVLSQSVGYSVYLPADYNDGSEKEYGVVYLLHGYGDRNTAWMNSINVGEIADRLTIAGVIDEFIYVMPDGYNSYYVNTSDGSFRYMDMFVGELVPHIDAAYRTKASKEYRAVAGYSMGGFGAMILPSANPDVFTVSCPLSMSVRTDDQYTTEPAGAWDNQWGAIFGGKGTTGEARLTDYYKKHSPFHFFSPATAAKYQAVRYFLDCGDDEEQLSAANDELHILMRESGIGHSYRVRDGAHTTSYWVRAMDEALRFIDAAFKNQPYDGRDSFAPRGKYTADLSVDGPVKELGGQELKVFLPHDYDTNREESYHTVYYSTGAEFFTDDHAAKVMSTLDSLQRVKPFIMIIADGSDAPAGFGELAAWVDSNYHTISSPSGRIGIGYGDGAQYLLNSGEDAQTAVGSLFLSDANVDISDDFLPDYCYIDITDGGTNYPSAHELYLFCRDNDIRHEYRVRAGTDDERSLLSDINSMTYYLGLRLNFR